MGTRRQTHTSCSGHALPWVNSVRTGPDVPLCVGKGTPPTQAPGSPQEHGCSRAGPRDTAWAPLGEMPAVLGPLRTRRQGTWPGALTAVGATGAPGRCRDHRCPDGASRKMRGGAGVAGPRKEACRLPPEPLQVPLASSSLLTPCPNPLQVTAFRIRLLP